ncbi:MAG: radical SAM protein [Planctomycetes bacterium]|nr:radical SAM protein [Planctomycetota bacterium]
MSPIAPPGPFVVVLNFSGMSATALTSRHTPFLAGLVASGRAALLPARASRLFPDGDVCYGQFQARHGEMFRIERAAAGRGASAVKAGAGPAPFPRFPSAVARVEEALPHPVRQGLRFFWSEVAVARSGSPHAKAEMIPLDLLSRFRNHLADFEARHPDNLWAALARAGATAGGGAAARAGLRARLAVRYARLGDPYRAGVEEIDAARATGTRVIYRAITRIDNLSHRHGPRSLAARAELARIDRFVETVARRLEERGDHWRLAVCSSTGQMAVRRAVSPWALMSRAAARTARGGGGLLFFIDSTALRLWCDDPARRARLAERLAARADLGLLLTGEHRARLGLPAGGEAYERFGHLVFALRPGLCFRPNFWQGNRLAAGMHGYAEGDEVADLRGFFLVTASSGERWRGRAEIVEKRDFAPTILRLAEAPIPPAMDGAPAFDLDLAASAASGGRPLTAESPAPPAAPGARTAFNGRNGRARRGGVSLRLPAAAFNTLRAARIAAARRVGFPGRSPRPHVARLMVTAACNAGCGSCHMWKNGRDGELSTRRWRALIADLAAGGVSSMNFTGGEPLLREDLESLVEAAAASGATPSMVTNGLLLSPARARALLDASLASVTLSIDGAGESQDRLRGVPGHGRVSVARLQMLAAMRRARPFGLHVACTLSALTFRGAEAVAALAARHGAGIFFNLVSFAPHHFRAAENARYWIGPADLPDFLALLDRLAAAKRRGAAIGNSHAALAFARRYFLDPRDPATPCLLGHVEARVDPRGNLFPCHAGPPVGNLTETPFRDLLASHRYARLVAAMERKECAGCACDAKVSLDHHLPSIVGEVLATLRR